MGHIDPTKEVFAQFRANDRPGPIHMLNLVRLRAMAAYPDGRKASGADYLVANTLEMVEGDRAGAYLLSDSGEEWVPRAELAARMVRVVKETL